MGTSGRVNRWKYDVKDEYSRESALSFQKLLFLKQIKTEKKK